MEVERDAVVKAQEAREVERERERVTRALATKLREEAEEVALTKVREIGRKNSAAFPVVGIEEQSQVSLEMISDHAKMNDETYDLEQQGLEESISLTLEDVNIMSGGTERRGGGQDRRASESPPRRARY